MVLRRAAAAGERARERRASGRPVGVRARAAGASAWPRRGRGAGQAGATAGSRGDVPRPRRRGRKRGGSPAGIPARGGGGTAGPVRVTAPAAGFLRSIGSVRFDLLV